MKIFNIPWQKIPKDKWPQPGEVYLCLDPQMRLGTITWSVSRMGDGTLEGDSTQLGLFWERKLALDFAAVQNNKPRKYPIPTDWETGA